MSLRLRLTLFFSGFIALILAAVTVASFVMTERFLDQALAERAEEVMQRMDGAPYNEIDGLMPSDIVWDIVILGAADVSIESIEDLSFFEGSLVPDRPLRDLLGTVQREALVEDGEVTMLTHLPTGEDVLLLARLGTVVYVSGLERYMSLIIVGVPATSATSALGQLRSALFLTSLAGFVVFALGVWLLSRRVLSPLHRITQSAARVTSQDLSHRMPVPRSHDEMREMAVTINRMLDRLEESFETQRRFTADASHELRTPVTAIQGHSNYLLRRTRPDPEQVDSLTVIRRESERMAKLVNDLLELARADAGFSIDMEPMNLLEVAENVHLEVAPVAGSAEITISSHQPVVQVRGDATRLKQVVLNLVMNALNAGATQVSIGFFTEQGSIVMEILDNGPGIPENAIPHLFERFYRVDGARSTRGNGSGLGLAIVNWIVQQHGGSVEVESKLGEGTVFRVRLPRHR